MTNLEIKELNTTANDLSQLNESEMDSIVGGYDWETALNEILQIGVKAGATALSEEIAGWFS